MGAFVKKSVGTVLVCFCFSAGALGQSNNMSPGPGMDEPPFSSTSSSSSASQGTASAGAKGFGSVVTGAYGKLCATTQELAQLENLPECSADNSASSPPTKSSSDPVAAPTPP